MRVSSALLASMFGLLWAVPAIAQSKDAGGPPNGAANGPPATGYYVTRSGTAMGTFVQMRIYIDKPQSSHTPELEATIGGHIERAFAEVRRLEALMTTWSET